MSKTEKTQYIGWSFDTEECPVFTDVVNATSSQHAEKLIERRRPYATVDAYGKPMKLTHYIINLARELKRDKAR